MKLVISEIKDLRGLDRGSSWVCFQSHWSDHSAVWEMMGFKVVELPDDEGQKLLSQQAVSIQLQIKLRDMFHKPTPTPTPSIGAPLRKDGMTS